MNNPEPEALAVPEGYGMDSLGENHWPLDEVYRRIHDARSWWIISVRADHRPHSTPVWGLALDDRIIFSSAPDATKTRNLAANTNIVMNLESGDEVVIVEGACEFITYEQLPARFAETYNTKYDIELDFTGDGFAFFEITPRKIMAWDEGDFVGTAARWRW